MKTSSRLQIKVKKIGMIKKYATLIILFLFTLHLIYAENEIYLSPITKTILFDYFTDTLNPFIRSREFIPLDNKTVLELINELEFTNGLYGDILKVKVVSGYYKGKIGYVVEDKVRITEETLKNGVYIYFKKNIQLPNGSMLNKKSRCLVKESRIAFLKEIVSLSPTEIPNKKNSAGTFDYEEKSDYRFIINKKTELSYYKRRQDIIIKTIDSKTLFPVIHAKYNNDTLSDEYGFMYIEKEDYTPPLTVAKKGYTKGILLPALNKNNLYLNFMTSLDYINYYDDRNSLYEKDMFVFTIEKNNKSVSKKQGIKIFTPGTFTVFCNPLHHPSSPLLNTRLIGSFYLDDVPEYLEITCRFKTPEQDIHVFHFDTTSYSWNEIIITHTTEDYSMKNLQSGYYLVVSSMNSDTAKVTIENDRPISALYLVDKETGIVKYTEDQNFSIPKGRYELLAWSPEISDNIVQALLYIDTDTYKIDIRELIENTEVINKKNYLSHLFNGIWNRDAVKKNNHLITTITTPVLEYLGNMTIKPHGLVDFSTDKYTIDAYFEIIDDKRMYIHIINSDIILINHQKQQKSKVSPSLLDCRLVIPAYYSFYVGIFQISFDMIYYKRNRLYYTPVNEDQLLVMESVPFGNTVFAKSEKETKYKIFFTQQY